MGRCKISNDIELNGHRAAVVTAAVEDDLSRGEYYDRRYGDIDSKRQATGLYGGSTEMHRKRMERLWNQWVLP